MHNFFTGKRQFERGMTLVELLVVMAILSVVMMAVISLYVPAHQSTVAQTQVSDVNANLRLALRVMTHDLMLAGFLAPVNPVVFPDAAPDYKTENLDDIGTVNAIDFIIRTRIVGSDFARIQSSSDLDTIEFQLNVSDTDMSSHFPAGSRVRLFEPISSNEVKSNVGSDADRAYPVVPGAANAITINKSAVPSLSITDIPAETVVVRIRDENQPPLQTIRYRLDNGALLRIVNDTPQVLARNVDTADFNYFFTPQGRVNRIDIALTGKTKAIKDDAISGGKSRQIKTSVKLRNVN